MSSPAPSPTPPPAAALPTPSRFPPPVLFPSAPTPTSALIFLHGRGDTATTFSRNLSLNSPNAADIPLFSILPHTKLIFPSCDLCLTRNHKCRHHQWFDLSHRQSPEKFTDEEILSLRECVEYVHRVVEETIAGGVPAERVFLAGLSQGCCAAVLAALTGKWRLGGLIGVSGYVVWAREMGEELKGEMEPVEVVRGLARRLGVRVQEVEVVREVLRMRVWLGHADDDDVVGYGVGQEMCAALEGLRMEVSWNKYTDVGHWYKVPEEIDDMAAFLKECGVDVKGNEEEEEEEEESSSDDEYARSTSDGGFFER